MKRGTPEHPKTKALAAELGVGLAQAVGHLELLWHFTARYAPRGDVGRFPDAAIEEACAWTGRRGKLLKALLKCRWLDAIGGEDRLLIHDWPDHAEDSIHKVLARGLEWFAAGPAPGWRRLTGEERQRAEAFYQQPSPEGAPRAHDGRTPGGLPCPASASASAMPGHALPGHAQPPASSEPSAGRPMAPAGGSDEEAGGRKGARKKQPERAHAVARSEEETAEILAWIQQEIDEEDELPSLPLQRIAERVPRAEIEAALMLARAEESDARLWKSKGAFFTAHMIDRCRDLGIDLGLNRGVGAR